MADELSPTDFVSGAILEDVGFASMIVAVPLLLSSWAFGAPNYGLLPGVCGVMSTWIGIAIQHKTANYLNRECVPWPFGKRL